MSVTNAALGRVTWALGVANALDDVKNVTLVTSG